MRQTPVVRSLRERNLRDCVVPSGSARGASGPRAGMTILEVLFAIMITTVGLLGAIAVFPVASEYARKGRLNDEVAVMGESAGHKIDAMGMRRPDHWITWRFDTNTNSWVMFSGPGMIIPGESYCLDPRFLTFARPDEPLGIGNITATGNPSPPAIPTYPQSIWFPAFPRAMIYSGPNDPNNGGPGSPRMQRITLVNGAGFAPPFPPPNAPNAPAVLSMGPMGRFQADFAFSFFDQLAYERPGVQKGATTRSVDNAEPPFQLLSPIKDVNNPGTTYPGKREDEGRLSWMATFVPKIDRWNATLEDKYVLSIVVFYNRSPNLVIPDFTQPVTKPINEWGATILGSNFYSSGYGGGEVTISVPAADPFATDKLKMRAGDWVMLSGNVQARNPANGNPITVPTYKWYRISDADEDPYANTVNGVNYMQRDVTLVGPDWDLQDVLPFNMGVPQGDGNPDDVDVTIVPGVVAVFDRTVRLERDGTGY